jgi:Protein of unknown function (DUF2800)
MSTHAKWSPSGSPAWLHCPARVTLGPGEDTTSPAAEEGTRLHDLAEQLIWTRDIESKASPEDLEKLLPYIEYVRHRSLDPDTNVLTEEKCELLSVTGEAAHGTIDALVVGEKYMEIIDLKTGQHRVPPDSEQLKMYAAACVYEVDYEGLYVVCTVHQGGIAHSWSWETDHLLAWADEVRKYVDYHEARAKQGIHTYSPSEKTCRYCPHITDCEAQKKLRDTLAASDFAVPEATDVDHDADLGAALGAYLNLVPALEAWCKAVRERVETRLKKGKTVPGFKLVEARSNRKWKADAEKKLFALLGDAAYDKKLIGLTAADKLVDAETMGMLTDKPKGAPTVAPEDDPRPALNDAATDFKNAK